MGVRISGSGAPLFLFAGIFLMLSARGWHQSLAKVTTLNQQVIETQEEKKKVEGEKKEIAKTALELDAKVSSLNSTRN